tara:strand:+ start:348 stop:1622 length:1275 start_codon:yes stop_codon:yes gene_type:complete
LIKFFTVKAKIVVPGIWVACSISLVSLYGCGGVEDFFPPRVSVSESIAQAIAPPEPDNTRMNLVVRPFKEIPGWKADKHSIVLPAFLRSCEKFRNQSQNRSLGFDPRMGKIKDWLPLCDDAARVRTGNDTDARYFFESRFQAYTALKNNNTKGLFTGYYEPELRGSWKRDDIYHAPIYSQPKDLIGATLGSFDDKWIGEKIVGRIEKGRFVPYYDRAEIEGGSLKGRQLEILWVDDAIEAFFLHIQGSGRIRLPDGSHIRLGYGGRNGHQYTSVGRELVAAGVMQLKEITMPSIRRWMMENPLAATALMRRNRSYIFFKVLETKGPIGAQGVVLTPGRSLAVDNDFIPYGVPLWLSTTYPGTAPSLPLRRLVIAQDTGSAIKGAVRGDLFWGFGATAGEKAGVMKQSGSYYLLLPRNLELKPTS